MIIMLILIIGSEKISLYLNSKIYYKNEFGNKNMYKFYMCDDRNI